MVNRAILLAHRMVFEGGGVLSPTALDLLRRSLASLAEIGVEKVCLVDGERADILEERLHLDDFPTLDVTVLSNRSWRKASGSAVLVAREFLESEDTPCLVLRGDRPLQCDALRDLASISLGDDIAAVVVASPPDTNLSDEVKVEFTKAETLRVSAMGLDLHAFDGIFTGHVVIRPGFVGWLGGMSNPTIENALHRLASEDKVAVLERSVRWTWNLRQPTGVEDTVAALLESKEHPHYTLLNPGPVNTTPHVKSAMVHHDVCHRDSSFSELMVSLTNKLKRIFRATDDHTTVLITGSGTAAMECAISSSVPRDGKLLIVDNGAFGERLYEIARLHEMDIVHLRYAWGDEVEPADVERMFQEHPDISVIAMIYHETSVGLLNPIRQIGAMARRHDALLIVDAVSALGAEELDVVRDNIDICYGSANKCLHAISGVGFLCISPRVWPKIEHIKPRSYYLDLKRYRRYIEEYAQTPFTPAVSTYFALDAACGEFLEDGHSKRWNMYKRRNRRLRQGLADLGMAPFTRTGRESHSVVTCCVPEGVSFQELYDGLKSRGYIIYGCKDVLADKFLQVANMGDLDDDAIDKFLSATRDVLSEIRVQSVSPPALRSTHVLGSENRPSL